MAEMCRGAQVERQVVKLQEERDQVDAKRLVYLEARLDEKDQVQFLSPRFDSVPRLSFFL